MIFTLVGCQSKVTIHLIIKVMIKSKLQLYLCMDMGGTNNSEKYMVNQAVKKCYKGCSYSVCFI